jgi:hypothetical protein
MTVDRSVRACVDGADDECVDVHGRHCQRGDRDNDDNDSDGSYYDRKCDFSCDGGDSNCTRFNECEW